MWAPGPFSSPERWIGQFVWLDLQGRRQHNWKSLYDGLCLFYEEEGLSKPSFSEFREWVKSPDSKRRLGFWCYQLHRCFFPGHPVARDSLDDYGSEGEPKGEEREDQPPDTLAGEGKRCHPTRSRHPSKVWAF